MFRPVITVLALILLGCLIPTNNAREFKDIVRDLRKYCPYYGFNGVLQCPDGSVTQQKSGGDVDPSYVLSGLGYDRVTRQIRFPVLPSASPTPASSTQFQTYNFGDVSSYLNTIFNQQSIYYGGLFVLGDKYVEQFASLFGNYKVVMSVVQKQYNSYNTAAASKTTIPEFQEILDSLPTYYDPNNQTIVSLYQDRLLGIFGTDVSITSTHGGIFFQQTAVKQCYSGPVGPDAEQELDTTISNNTVPVLAYTDYRQLGVFDVRGGNPQIPHPNWNQIIASFPTDPAITGFTSVPIWTLVPANYQAAVQAAVEHYSGVKQSAVATMIQQINTQKIQSYEAPQNVFVYARQNEQYGNILYWNNCPFVPVGDNYYTPRCSFSFQTDNLNSGDTATIVDVNFEDQGMLLYKAERAGDNGTMRIWGSYTPFQLNVKPQGKDKSGPQFTVKSNDPNFDAKVRTAVGDSVFMTAWQHTGCVDLDYIEMIDDTGTHLLYFTACIDCLPVVVTSPAYYGLVDSDLNCVCEGFNDLKRK